MFGQRQSGEHVLANLGEADERIAADEGDVVAMLGVTPIEDLIDGHGEAAIDWIEQEARNPRLPQTLGSAWLWVKVSDSEFHRLQAAPGVEPAHPRRQQRGDAPE